MHKFFLAITTLVIVFAIPFTAYAQHDRPKGITVTAYYHGDGSDIDQYPVGKLTHIIYSFCHLQGNRLTVDNATGSHAITKLVSLKKKYPKLKILVSLGGWAGCPTCPEVFATANGRQEFAASCLKLIKEYKVDGLDLDWEYPAIESLPGFSYSDADRPNFTALIRQLRTTLGPKYEITFAAGGFSDYFIKSVEWKRVMPLVNRVYLMTYDYTNGYSSRTGHHTPLYSTPEQKGSADHAVRFLDSLGVPRNKMVIGAAFYARCWSEVEPANNGLYQDGKFTKFVNFKDIDSVLPKQAGYEYHFDSIAQAPYYYNPGEKVFGTFDDVNSVVLKTRYSTDQKLNGIMFWSLSGDRSNNGLLDAIYRETQKAKSR